MLVVGLMIEWGEQKAEKQCYTSKASIGRIFDFYNDICSAT